MTCRLSNQISLERHGWQHVWAHSAGGDAADGALPLRVVPRPAKDVRFLARPPVRRARGERREGDGLDLPSGLAVPQAAWDVLPEGAEPQPPPKVFEKWSSRASRRFAKLSVEEPQRASQIREAVELECEIKAKIYRNCSQIRE